MGCCRCEVDVYRAMDLVATNSTSAVPGASVYIQAAMENRNPMLHPSIAHFLPFEGVPKSLTSSAPSSHIR